MFMLSTARAQQFLIISLTIDDLPSNERIRNPYINGNNPLDVYAQSQTVWVHNT